MSDLLVDYFIYFTSHWFFKAQGFVVRSFYSQLGEREEWRQRKILILKISFFGHCSVIKGQAFPALQTAHSSGLLHQAALLTLVIYWDSHDSARLFLCGFGGGFENRVCEMKWEGGKWESVMHHSGGPCALQGGFGVGEDPECWWHSQHWAPSADGATLVGSVTKDTSARMAVEVDMWNRWWGTGSTKKDSKPPSTHTYPRVLALAGKWERF